MSKLSKNTLVPSAVLLSISLVLGSNAVAANALEAGVIQNQTAASFKQSASTRQLLVQSRSEINSPVEGAEVSEPLNLEPTDSTAQSLPSTENTERYGCVSGYSDRTYQGEQPISRYEFAAGLNACLNQIQQRIDNNAADQVTPEDLAVPKRQLESLGLELERLRLRIDGLESRL
jgi:hypothetical protein